MSIRRGWTTDQDRILKMLKEERNIKKWSSIARIMDFQFNMCGRNGKQCRERYNNHLSEGILQQKLSFEQEKLLQALNDRVGNKWSVIAKAFKGRTANFLKNQLYSKLRKSVRKLNKFIKEMKMKSSRLYKLSIVYKIVQSNDFKIFEKQRHSFEDLKFYSQIKQKLFLYAEEPLLLENENALKQIQIMNESRDIIDRLNVFSRKYEDFNKKMKKPRKRYFCQDDIILNSLSNNKASHTLIQKNAQKVEQQKQELKQNQSQNQQSSQTSDKKAARQQKSQANRLEMRILSTNNLENQNAKEFNQKQMDNTPKNELRKLKTIKQLEVMANQNCQIVEYEDLEHRSKGYQLLQQSQQCQFIDIQYMEHFKSCSLIDQSLFQ